MSLPPHIQNSISYLSQTKDRKQFALCTLELTNMILSQKMVEIPAILTDILTLALDNPELRFLVLSICKATISIICFHPLIESIIEKYCEKDTIGNAKQVKIIEEFIGSFCLLSPSQTLIPRLVQKSRSSQCFCLKLLRSLLCSVHENPKLKQELYYHTKLTNIAQLLINLVKVNGQINISLLNIAYEFLELLMVLCPELMAQMPLFQQKFIGALSVYNLFPNALKIICLMINKQLIKGQNLNDLVMRILSIISDHYISPKSNLSVQRKKIKESGGQQQQGFTEFFTAIAHFLITIQPISYPNINERVIELSKQLLFVDVQECVRASLRYLHKMNFLPSIQFNQSMMVFNIKAPIYNCLEFSSSDEVAKKIQGLNIQLLMNWIDNNIQNESLQNLATQLMNLGQKYLIIEGENGIQMGEHEFEEKPDFQNSIQFMLMAINKAIEYQFEYQFDQRIFISGCDLLMYIKNSLIEYYADNPVTLKQKLTNIIKSLMNVNESIQHSYKPVIVKKIIELFINFSEQIIDPQNHYLVEVGFKLLTENLPWSLNQYWQFIKKGYRSQYSARKLYQFLNSRYKTCYPNRYGEVEKIWEILLILNQDKNVNEWGYDDSWVLIRGKVGQQMNKENIRQEELQKYRSQASKLGLQFQYDLEASS